MYPYFYLIISSYAVMAMLGAFVSICYVYIRMEKVGVQFTDLLRVLVFGGLGLIVGSKLLYAITQIPWLIKNFSIVNLLLLIPQSGYVFYGGLFGFIISICIISKGNYEYRKKLFLLITPVFPLFHMFGRIGCFLAGCCYGKKLSSSIYIFNIEISRIPVQLIEAAIELLIFIMLCVIGKGKKKIDILEVYLISYAIVRFGLEFLRGDEIRGIFIGLSTSQWISIVILLYYFIKNLLLENKKQNN